MAEESTEEVIERLAARRDELMEENRELQAEMERYRQEAYDNAKVVGGILRVLRDNDLIDSWRGRS